MPDSGLPDDTVLTSSFYDPFIREQVLVTCTSATRPAGVEGRYIHETDTGRLLHYDGADWVIDSSPWTSYTPTLVGITIGDGTQTHAWAQAGELIYVRNTIVFGSTTAFPGWPLIAPPVPISYAWGQADMTDDNTSTNYLGAISANTGTQIGVITTAATAAYVFTSATSPFTWAVDDTFSMSYTARVA